MIELYIGFIVMLQHSRIRATYNIDGTTGGDCVQSFFCARCTLMQDDREVRSRERKIASERGQNEVRKQPGPQPQMRYSTSNLLEEIPDIFRPVAANPGASTPQLPGTPEAQASEPLLPGVNPQEHPQDSNPNSALHCGSLPSKQGSLKSHVRASSSVGSALNPITRSSSVGLGGREKVWNMPQRCATNPVRPNATMPPFPRSSSPNFTSYQSRAKAVEEAPERLPRFNTIKEKAKSGDTNPSISSNAGMKSFALDSSHSALPCHQARSQTRTYESIIVYYDLEDEPQRRRLSDCSRLRVPTPETPDIYDPRSSNGTVEGDYGASDGASVVKQVHNAGIMKSLINEENAVETTFQLSSTPQCLDSAAALCLTNGTVDIVSALCMQNTNAGSLGSTVEGMAAPDAATEVKDHGKSQGMDISSTRVFVDGMNGNNADNCGEVYTAGEESISHDLNECCSKNSAAKYRGDGGGDGEDCERLGDADGDQQQRIARPAHAFQAADQVGLASAENATGNAEAVELNIKNFTSVLPDSLEGTLMTPPIGVAAQQSRTESAKIDNANGYSASTLATINEANDYSLVILKALPAKLETPNHVPGATLQHIPWGYPEDTNPLLDQLAKNTEQDHAIEGARIENSNSCKTSTSALALHQCDASSMDGVAKPPSQISHPFSGKSSVIDFAHINPKNVDYMVDDWTKSGYSDLAPKSFQSNVLNMRSESEQSARDQDLVSEDCDYFSAEQHMTDDSDVSPEKTDNFTVIPLALKPSLNTPVIESDELRLVCDRINSHQLSYESTSSESTVGPLTPPLTINKLHIQKRVASPAETILRTVLGIPSKYAVSEVERLGAGSKQPVKDESPKGNIKLGGRRARHRRERKRRAAEAGTKMKKENSSVGMSLTRS